MKDQREEKKVKQKGVGVFKIIWNIISRLLTVLIIIICLIIGVQKVTNNKESFFGYRIFRVQTGSMIPKYQIGDILVVKINKDGENARFNELTRMSKPGRRMYVGVEEIPRIKSGRGMVIISTSKGVMNGFEARKQRLGGELLLKVW